MNATGVSLKRIEDAMTQAASPLSRALKALGEANRGRGTCLLLEHEEFGEVLIADRFWTRGREETLKGRSHFALVDLEQEQGFNRVAVLVEPSGVEGPLTEEALALALSALEVTSALAAVAAPKDDAPRGELAPRDAHRQSAAPGLPPPPSRDGAGKDERAWGI